MQRQIPACAGSDIRICSDCRSACRCMIQDDRSLPGRCYDYAGPSCTGLTCDSILLDRPDRPETVWKAHESGAGSCWACNKLPRGPMFVLELQHSNKLLAAENHRRAKSWAYSIDWHAPATLDEPLSVAPPAPAPHHCSFKHKYCRNRWTFEWSLPYALEHASG